MGLLGFVSALGRPVAGYARWLHTGNPAGLVEPLPEVKADGSTRVHGLFVTGDLLGVPLLKFAADSGARIVRKIARDPGLAAERRPNDPDTTDLVIVGGGVSGIAAAIEAKKHSLSCTVLEASPRTFNTIADFPKGKTIYTYPPDMEPAGDLKITAEVKEELVEELQQQAEQAGIEVQTAWRAVRIRRDGAALEVVLDTGRTVRARRVIVAIGRSGNYRKLDVPGEELDKVYNRLHDPADWAEEKVLVVGGGDSALEAAVSIARAGGEVTLSYRKAAFSRPKSENLEALRSLSAPLPAPGRVRLLLSSRVKAIGHSDVTLAVGEDGTEQRIDNDVVFTLIGREAPLEFFRRSGIPIVGEWSIKRLAGLAAFASLVTLIYLWKGWGGTTAWFQDHGWFPFNMPAGGYPRTHILGVVQGGLRSPSFYYTLVYSALIVIFGIRRIRRRRTEYVKVQTLVLMAFQVLPLFLLPEIILPYLGRNALLPEAIRQNLFTGPGGGEEYWRAYGLILAWPLSVYNVFTDAPNAWWLSISFVQTFVVIPVLVYFFGKGAYCGWICPCGALAETLGDNQRTKMPHGPFWNRLNMTGQVILGVCFALLAMRVYGWVAPESWAARNFNQFLAGFSVGGIKLNYKWIVDAGLAGIVGVACYFWYSGRVWCRFFCPLAALMHVFARFTTFRILADKKKCISCNVCTSVCHQGIDVMNFANKGRPLSDVQCVRCSACVQSCPTGVLSFGRVRRGGGVISVESLQASPLNQIRKWDAPVTSPGRGSEC